MDLDTERKLHRKWLAERVPVIQAEQHLGRRQSRWVAQREWVELQRQLWRIERGLKLDELRCLMPEGTSRLLQNLARQNLDRRPDE
jgi:hypothetical protein